MGRGFRSEVWTGRLVADGVDTEAKTNRGPSEEEEPRKDQHHPERFIKYTVTSSERVSHSSMI